MARLGAKDSNQDVSEWPEIIGVSGITAVKVSAGTTSNNLSAITFSNANGISFGINASTMTASHNALTTAMASNRGSDFVQATAAFAGTNATGTIASGGISVSVGNYITTAMASNRGSDFVQATAAFAGTSASGTIASGGISVSIGPYITTAMASNRGTDFVQATAAFAGTSASGTIASGGISVSIGPYITTAALSNHSHGVSFTSGSVAFQTLSFTNSNGISFNSGTQGIFGSHNAITTAALSGDTSKYVQAWELTGNTAGTTSSAQGTKLYVSGGNNITVSGNSNTIVISAPNAVAQTNQTIGVYASSNTTLTSSGTIDARSFSIRGIQGITVGYSANEIILSGAAGGAGTVSSATTASSVTTNNVVGADGGRYALEGHQHAGINRIGVSNIGNTAGNTTLGHFRSVYLSGQANITISQATDANSDVTIGFSAPTPGGGNNYSYFCYPDDVGNSITHTVGQSTSWVQPFDIPYALSVSYIRFPLTLSCIGSQAATATAANQTRGMTLSSTRHLVFYTQGTGASSRSLFSYTSASCSWVQRATLQAGATGSHWSSGHTISFPREGGNTDFTSSAGASSASYTVQSSQLSNFTGLRFMDVPFAGSFAAGMYWVAIGTSTSLSTVGNANMSTLRILGSGFAITQPNQAFNLLGSATNSSNHYRMGLGSYTTNVINTTATLPLSGISTSASHPIYPFEMIRQA